MKTKGIVAAGHRKTAQAAEIILQSGGNAFDAVVAAQFAACVAEPVFTSLGGGGFLLAHRSDGAERLYDFFVQTPRKRRPVRALEFYPIDADFGPATQEFHIGMGAIAVPGMIKGLFQVHAELCTLPMARIMEPAIALARRGVRLNTLQAYSFRVLEKILTANATAFALYSRKNGKPRLLAEGERHRQPELADTLETLAREGERLFYRGDIAHSIAVDCREHGGSLRAEDLKRYRVIRRKPLAFRYHDYRLLTNPPPASGGILIAFALKLLEPLRLHAHAFGSADYLALLARSMQATQQTRARLLAQGGGKNAAIARRLLGGRTLDGYRRAVLRHPPSQRGTTHISVIDDRGNMASMTTSNGEGCGYVIPGTGIMLNNMLGEEDINPHGFHRWPPGTRLSSMLSPTLLFAKDGSTLAIGSGGSNRIRTAMQQVLLNVMEFRMSVKAAVDSPRIHFENDWLDIEAGFERRRLASLASAFPKRKVWEDRSLFFGGAHAAGYDACRKRFHGAGDPRRGGVCIRVAR